MLHNNYIAEKQSLNSMIIILKIPEKSLNTNNKIFNIKNNKRLEKLKPVRPEQRSDNLSSF